MKKRLAVLLTMAAMAGMLAGCGSGDVTESTIELKKDGRIVEYTLEDFSESYYDPEELKSYVESEVESWLGENDGSIKISRSEVEDQTAYLTMQYDSADTFADFNGFECFAGSIVQAQAAGYDFDTDFVAAATEDAEEDSSVSESNIQTLIPGKTVIGDDNLKAFIIRDHVNVMVPGTIMYVSDDEHVQIAGKNTVSVDVSESDGDSDVLVYILYK